MKCDELPDVLKEDALKYKPLLVPRLQLLSTDVTSWEEVYRCRECGQIWIKKWEATGHGDVGYFRKAAGTQPDR